MADPELELRVGGGGGFDLLALLAFLPSVISSFLPKIRGEGSPLDPPLTSYCFVTLIVLLKPITIGFSFIYPFPRRKRNRTPTSK